MTRRPSVRRLGLDAEGWGLEALGSGDEANVVFLRFLVVG